MALAEIGFEVRRIAPRIAKLHVPVIGDGRERRIEHRSKRFHDVRQRIGEIPVLSLPEAVPGHDDTAAEAAFAVIELRQRRAAARTQEPRKGRVASLTDGL